MFHISTARHSPITFAPKEDAHETEKDFFSSLTVNQPLLPNQELQNDIFLFLPLC
jgi:hypothetical protein